MFKKPRKMVTFRLPEERYKELLKISKIMGQSQSDIVASLIECYAHCAEGSFNSTKNFEPLVELSREILEMKVAELGVLINEK